MSVVAVWRGWQGLLGSGIWHFGMRTSPDRVIHFVRPDNGRKSVLTSTSFERFRDPTGSKLTTPVYHVPVNEEDAPHRIVKRARDELSQNKW